MTLKQTPVPTDLVEKLRSENVFIPKQRRSYSKSLKFLCNFETDRFHYKGKTRFIASQIWGVTFVYLFNMIPNSIWPGVYETMPKDKEGMCWFVVKWIFIYTNIALIVANLFYLCIYLAAHPSLEKYKTQKHSVWPWKENWEEWKVKLTKTIL